MAVVGQKITIELSHMNPKGVAVGEFEGMTVEVRYGIPGDRVCALVEHQSPHQPKLFARLLKIEQPSAMRVLHHCGHAAASHRPGCGGCPMDDWNPTAVEQWKRTQLNDLLSAFPDPPTGTWHSLRQPRGYRNRSNFIVAHVSNRIKLCSFAPGTHTPCPMTPCNTVTPSIGAVMAPIEKALNRLHIPVYEQKSAPRDSLRYLTIRGFHNGHLLINLVTTTINPPWLPTLVTALLKIPNIKGISVTCNQSSGNAIRTQPPFITYGETTLCEPVGQLSLQLGAHTFFQLNTNVAALMYDRARALATPFLTSKKKQLPVVWDLFCGVGGLGLTVAKNMPGSRLFGAELVKSALELAKQNAALATIQGTFEAVDLDQPFTLDWPAPDIVVVNPPRKGLGQALLTLLTRTSAPIIYMSCNPKTFAENAAALQQSHQLASIDGYDMLPGTTHLELLALLTPKRT